MDKKGLYWSIAGVIITLIGSITVCLLGSPFLIIHIVGSGLLSFINIYKYIKEHK